VGEFFSQNLDRQHEYLTELVQFAELSLITLYTGTPAFT
jgi:hypothetical protein